MSVFLIVAVLGGSGYLSALNVHPYIRCHSCRGAGRHRGMMYGYAGRECRHCGGNGRQLRLGVRLFPGREVRPG
jgi:DnaJ-class molecular chaperone